MLKNKLKKSKISKKKLNYKPDKLKAEKLIKFLIEKSILVNSKELKKLIFKKNIENFYIAYNRNFFDFIPYLIKQEVISSNSILWPFILTWLSILFLKYISLLKTTT